MTKYEKNMLRLLRVQGEVMNELRTKRARCSQVCSCYNSEDRDCEIYGIQRTPPSRCGFYLDREVARRMETE